MAMSMKRLVNTTEITVENTSVASTGISMFSDVNNTTREILAFQTSRPVLLLLETLIYETTPLWITGIN